MSNIYLLHRVSVIQRRDNRGNRDYEDNSDKKDNIDYDDDYTDTRNGDDDKKAVEEVTSSLEVDTAYSYNDISTIQKRMVSTESDFTAQSERVED